MNELEKLLQRKHSHDAEKFILSTYQRIGNPEILYSGGLELLHHKFLFAGMKFYEHRWHMQELKVFKDALIRYRAKWVNTIGEITDSNLVVVGEQGIGDELMFSSVMPQIIGKPNKITWIASPQNYEFFKHNYKHVPSLEVLNVATSLAISALPILNAASHVTSIGELYRMYLVETQIRLPIPKYNGTIYDVEPIPSTVALVYKAGATNDTGPSRSFDPNALRYVLKGKNVVSFQMPQDSSKWFKSIGGSITSVLDTANKLATIKTIVTCDTAMAHIGLLLKKRVALIHREYIDWRWKNNLYPGVRLVHIGDLDRLKQFLDEEI